MPFLTLILKYKTPVEGPNTAPGDVGDAKTIEDTFWFIFGFGTPELCFFMLSEFGTPGLENEVFGTPRFFWDPWVSFGTPRFFWDP